LRQRIVQGESTPGTMVPSEVELSTECGVSRNTLRRALAELEEERLTTTVLPGRGRVVAELEHPQSGSKGAEPSYRVIATAPRVKIESGELAPERCCRIRPI
jgi:DNA-binding FadR family transcriptional regulator